MLRARIIPCLLLRDGGLVKTRRFKDDKYVGDPINAVRIFNEKEADELIVLDLDATIKGREPDYRLIEHLASECRMPLCYGGGVSSVEQARRIMSLGVEKVALSSVLAHKPEIVAEIADQVGTQSTVAVLDIRKRKLGLGWRVYTRNGTQDTGLCPISFSPKLETLGVGEIVLNSIDHDGMMDGYDLNLAERVRNVVRVPITILGGAGSVAHLMEAVRRFGIIGAAAGSFFVFKGPYRAVLISYPTKAERIAMATPSAST